MVVVLLSITAAVAAVFVLEFWFLPRQSMELNMLGCSP